MEKHLRLSENQFLINYIPEKWKNLLEAELAKPYFNELSKAVEEEYAKQTVYPPQQLIFAALEKTPPEKVKVVIIGQDPYHGQGQANGLAFSVNESCKTPPSLRNIHKELLHCYPETFQLKKDLCSWAEQGVLLLNDVLTVRAGEPGSHQNLNWQMFTDAILDHLILLNQPLVIVQWGMHAQKKAQNIPDRENILQIKSSHPSPFSAHKGFLGSQVFRKTNEFLNQCKLTIVNW